MLLVVGDTQIHYKRYGKTGGPAIVLLHGWGQNIEMMEPVGNAFQDTCDIIIFDLPGYGQSSEPTTVWTVYDYVTCIHTCLEQLQVTNPILIGHSFGGKISLLYASQYEVSKLILFASPFKKEIANLSLKTKTLKTLKKVPVLNKLEGFAKKHIGSVDYRNASPRMREILVETVNCDIREEVKKITCPTLLIWGTLDDAVSIEQAYELESLLKDAAVIPYDGCTHYAYLERIGQTINVLHSFLGR